MDSTEETVDVAFTGFRSFVKLVLILTSYSSAFISLIQFGFWTCQVRKIDCNVVDWYGNYCNGLWTPWRTAELLAFNLGLLFLFMLQHSVMTRRNLIMTKYWELFHYRWEIDKAVYNIMTAFALQILINLWQPVGIALWEISFINDPPYMLHFIIHIISWAIFYGTNLMVDLPDLIGLNQIAPECASKVVKSPELTTMIENQRHMGMLPLTVILLFHPYMSFDRLLLTMAMVTYSYCCWKSQSCYPYAKSMRRVKRVSEKIYED